METTFLSYVRTELAKRKLADWVIISDQCDVPLSTIKKVHYGMVTDPRVSTVQKLHDHFKAERRARWKQARKAA